VKLRPASGEALSSHIPFFIGRFILRPALDETLSSHIPFFIGRCWSGFSSMTNDKRQAENGK
jgi:hypothetical protein